MNEVNVETGEGRNSPLLQFSVDHEMLPPDCVRTKFALIRRKAADLAIRRELS
jgi:hypothetical protein